MKKKIDERIKMLIEEYRIDINLCYAVYQLIEMEEYDKRAEAFREFIILAKSMKTVHNKELSYVNQDRLADIAESLITKAENYIKYMMLHAEIDNLSEKDFDKELWSYIESFETKEEKAFLMLCYCFDGRYPYYNISKYTKNYVMSDDEYYNKKLEYGFDKISKARYIIGSKKFRQYTEQAYAFWKMIEEADSEIGKVLILAEIIKHYDILLNEQILEEK